MGGVPGVHPAGPRGGVAVEYLFLDAIYESRRLQGGGAEGLLCAWGILADGRKVLLHLTLGHTESYRCWLEMLRDMVRRGLRPPVSITSDGAPGLVRAIKETWPTSLRIRCWVHRMRNVLDKGPDAARAEVKAHLVAIRDAPTYEAGRQAAKATLARFEGAYPTAMASLREDLEASLAHLRLPAAHRQYVRTTQLIERSCLEERRRSKVIPRFFDERSCLKLVYATLVRASQRLAADSDHRRRPCPPGALPSRPAAPAPPGVDALETHRHQASREEEGGVACITPRPSTFTGTRALDQLEGCEPPTEVDRPTPHRRGCTARQPLTLL